MKRYIPAFILAATVLSACSDFLEERTITSVSEATVYSSESSLEAAVYGLYSAFLEKNDQSIAGKENELLHSASGLYTIYTPTSPLTNLDYATQYLKLGIHYKSTKNNGRYALLYSALNKANSFLENVGSADVDEKLKSELAGEAHFLRAYSYFCLVRCWGDVPLILKAPTTTDEANVPRTSFWLVYKTIVEDLNIAFETMRDYEGMCAASGPASGRPCNYAAKALLSEVYLTIGSLLQHPEDNFWDPAVTTPDFSALGINNADDAFKLSFEAADDVIRNGPYELEPLFKNLFRWTLQDTPGDEDHDWKLKERVFTFNITVKSGVYSYLSRYSLPICPEGTLQKENNNSTARRWKISRYLFQKWCSDYPGQKGDHQLNENIWVSSSDPRLDASIYYYSYFRQDHNSDTMLYPYFNNIYVTNFNSEMNVKKYLDPRYDNNQGYADMYVIRFAQMFLNAAEAAANLSKSVGDAWWQKAYEYIDVLHQRARRVEEDGEIVMKDQPKWAEDRFASASDPIQAMRDAMFWERMYEMILEGHEFYDSHRHGAGWLRANIAEPIEKFLKEDEQYYSNGYSKKPENTTNSYVVMNYGRKDFSFPSAEELRKSLIAGFPEVEMNVNPSIGIEDQNPYYWE